ncbi:hypothetical protein N9R70_03555 [Porticoccaceae bacterium]|nr:hypothetical protein [Porticoccaceae bacterium]MDB2395099.1 hypothetical protein [Porticoccaceae bacterium]
MPGGFEGLVECFDVAGQAVVVTHYNIECRGGQGDGCQAGGEGKSYGEVF